MSDEAHPLIPLFLHDLVDQSRLLQESWAAFLQAVKEERDPTEVWLRMEAAMRTISGAARLVNYDAIAALAKSLEDLLASFRTRLKDFLQEAHFEKRESFEQALALFRALSESDLSHLTQKVEESKAAIQNLSQKLGREELKEEEKAAKPPEVIAQKPKAEFPIDHTMMDLFRAELQTQVTILNNGLVDLEGGEMSADRFEPLMRSAHSIKGAARVVGLEPIVQLSHAIEDCFVAAQKQQVVLQAFHFDAILAGIDLIGQLIDVSDEELADWIVSNQANIGSATQKITALLKAKEAPPKEQAVPQAVPKGTSVAPTTKAVKPAKTPSAEDRVLRVSAQSLNRLMGLAGESLVESRWLQPFSTSLLTIKKRLNELARLQDLLRETIDPKLQNETQQHYMSEISHKINSLSQSVTDRLTELDLFIIRNSSLSDRLYREVIDSRMRPFSDGIAAFPRLVRDLARELGKKVRLEIVGQNTPVDRDILDKLEAPLSHLLRNAVDHGIESPEERERQGKPIEGTIRLEALHRAGMLAINISDDGGGLDIETIRKKVVEKNLVKETVAARLNQAELLEFLFLPGFSTAKAVTEISGRGVGLNVVQSMIQEVAGSVRIESEPGKGMSFHLMLPLTLSVIRALIVDISGEPYAFPLARIDRALHMAREEINQVESRQYCKFEGQNIGLVPAAQVLELQESQLSETILPIILFSDRMNSYGIVVDQFLGERELVVQELDHRLGKVPDISSGALMEDGAPVLIVDVEDMVRSIDAILSGGRLHKLRYGKKAGEVRRKRILVVDDSITVREVESRLLQNHGYDVQTAVNGMDGWNALRMGDFDLLVTDVDMPRMNGIELIKLIRSDPKLKNLPVMIVSYKEREEDRRLGLEAGANYYLTKSSFHDETLIEAVTDLIGG